MPTIKTKKEMNLGELLCWAIDNKEQARFRDISSKSMRVRFNDNAKPEIIFAKRFLPIEQTFKVEIEEPITEDTVIPKMLEMYRDATSNLGAEIYINQSINSVIENAEVLTLHIVNDDGTHTLIWRNGKLVE